MHFDKTIASRVCRDPVCFIAFGFGSGLSPVAPGTVGSLVAIPLFFVLYMLPTALFWLAMLLAFAVGIWICEQASNRIRQYDHSGIVWDEFWGMWMALALLPEKTVLWVIAAFILFRLFDVLKPSVIGMADARLKGGFGVMADDLLAGFAAGSVVAIFHSIF